MNINELEKLAKEWNRFDADNEYSQSFLELIAAYREAVKALDDADFRIQNKEYAHACITIQGALATAKRLGVE